MTNPKTVQELENLYAQGKRCEADRDGDCDCEKAYRIEGNNHCYLDIIDDRETPERYGA